MAHHNLIKRVDQIEKRTPDPDKPVLVGMGDFYEFLKTPEAQADMEWLYGTPEEQAELMEKHHNDLKQRGLI